MRNFSEAELEALEKLNLGGAASPTSPKRTGYHGIESSPLAKSGSETAGKVNLEELERKASLSNEGQGTEEKVNGHS